MKAIDIKNQPTLGFARTFEICVNGIKYRFFRSIITMIVISVAIAFMMNVICEAIGLQSISNLSDRQTEVWRLGVRWASRLTAVSSPEAILREIASEKTGSPILSEAQRFGGLTDAEFQAYLAGVRQAARYLAFFEKLDYGNRRILVRQDTGPAIFDHLQSVPKWDRFCSALRNLRSVRLPDSQEEFRRFLDQWPAIKSQTQRIHEGRSAAVAQVNRLMAGRSTEETLMDAAGSWGDQVQGSGFQAFDAATRKRVAEQSRRQFQMRQLEESLKQPNARKVLAAYLDVLPDKISLSTFWKLMQERRAAEWYVRKTAENGVSLGGLSAEQIVGMANARMTQTSLEDILLMIKTSVQTDEKGLMGIGSRMTWLLLVSLLMCVVGICNAMLTAVTERFREIATLKCLGALDGFIMLLFVMEATLLGCVGGLLGGLLGSLIGFGRLMGTFGMIVLNSFPWQPWLTALGFSLVVGMLLAAIAGVYPSYMAARLAPMEVMRIE